MQRFTVAFNFLCVLLSLLYEGRHLSSSARRKITVSVFIQHLQTFYFIFEGTFFVQTQTAILPTKVRWLPVLTSSSMPKTRNRRNVLQYLYPSIPASASNYSTRQIKRRLSLSRLFL